MSKDVYTYRVDGVFGTVGTRIDLDGTVPTVILSPNRNQDDYKVEVVFTPALARKVARALNKAARSVQS
jgi:hypothetical protein